MVRNDLLGKRFLLNDVVDYDNFITLGKMYNLRWLDGHIMDSEVTDIFRKKSFPFVLEVDMNGYVSYDSHLARSVSVKQLVHAAPEEVKAVKTERPIALLVNQKNPGITVTLSDGREFVYDIDKALNDINDFNEWLSDITRPPIEVGDIVELIDAGQLYTTYHTWFKENNVDIDIAARYDYAGDVNLSTRGFYRVLAIGKHSNTDVMMYAITQKDEVLFGGNFVYLVDERGIKKVR